MRKRSSEIFFVELCLAVQQDFPDVLNVSPQRKMNSTVVKMSSPSHREQRDQPIVLFRFLADLSWFLTHCSPHPPLAPLRTRPFARERDVIVGLDGHRAPTALKTSVRICAQLADPKPIGQGLTLSFPALCHCTFCSC